VIFGSFHQGKEQAVFGRRSSGRKGRNKFDISMNPVYERGEILFDIFG